MPPITGYDVVHQAKGQTSIGLKLSDGTAGSVTGLTVEEAGFIVDLLRNEKPINFNKSTKTFSFGTFEPVGEGE